MKSQIVTLVCLIFAVCFTAASPVAAQNKSALYAAPQRLLLDGDEDEAAEVERAVLLREHFFPIGWSKDGKFAFYTEPPDEACGCYFGSLYIADLRTDKILWSREYSSEEGKADTLGKYWRQNQKQFSAMLAQYKIVPQKKFGLNQFPIKFGGDSLKPDLSDSLQVNDEDMVAGAIKLQLISQRNGAKTLYEKLYAPAKYDSIRGAEIGGVLVSPFEARAAIILIETHRGWEGPPNITQLLIIGADLQKGFR